MPRELIDLETPGERDWDSVIRLVLGGIADRLNLGFEQLDDLQLAVERLLVEAGTGERVRLSIELTESGLITRVGPLREDVMAAALRGEEEASGGLGLRRVLSTVVDAYAVEPSGAGHLTVRLDTSLNGG